MTKKQYFVNVLLAYNLSKEFTYKIDQYLEIGSIVKVPFRAKSYVGVVTAHLKKPSFDKSKVKKIISISDKFLALYPTLISRGETLTREPESSPATIIRLCNTVSQFIVDVERSALNADTTHSLASLMRVEHYIMSCTQKAQAVLTANMDADTLKAPELDRQVIDFFAATNTFLRMVRW
mgnify:CR=1 FL=1